LSQKPEKYSECFVCRFQKRGVVKHHIVPIVFGGTEDSSNFVYVCPSCHDDIHHTFLDPGGMNTQLAWANILSSHCERLGRLMYLRHAHILGMLASDPLKTFEMIKGVLGKCYGEESARYQKYVQQRVGKLDAPPFGFSKKGSRIVANDEEQHIICIVKMLRSKGITTKDLVASLSSL
jgi:hypothetical protein